MKLIHQILLTTYEEVVNLYKGNGHYTLRKLGLYMIVTPCELMPLYTKEIVLVHDYTLMVIICQENCVCIKDPSKEGTRPSVQASYVRKPPRCARDGPGKIQDGLRRCPRNPKGHPDAQMNSQDAPKRDLDAPRMA